jgi:hypothetical protein
LADGFHRAWSSRGTFSLSALPATKRCFRDRNSRGGAWGGFLRVSLVFVIELLPVLPTDPFGSFGFISILAS